MLKEAKNLVRRTEIEHAKSRITGEGLYLFSSDLSILKPEIRRDYTKLFHLLLGILSTHLGSGSRKSGFLRTVPVNTKVFLRGYQNPRRTLGVTTHFPEIIELKFLYSILKLFKNCGCLIISEKCVVTHIFLFGFQYTSLRSAFPP